MPEEAYATNGFRRNRAGDGLHGVPLACASPLAHVPRASLLRRRCSMVAQIRLQSPRRDFRAGHGHPFDQEEDVVFRANATPYELPAGLSRETSRARIGWRSRLDAGVVWLTTAMSRRSPCHSAVGSYRVLAARR